MDSKRFNIYAGAIIGSLLLFLLLNFFSNLIYVGPEHAEPEVLAFAVPTGEEAPAAEVEEPDWAALVAQASAESGQKVFNRCKACHNVEDGANSVGPHLWGVVGREIAALVEFNYSDALKDLEGDWGLRNLSAFLEDPSSYAPGTKMNFAGLSKIQDRIDVIVYLNEADGTPVELVEAPAEAPAAEQAPAGQAEEGQPAAEQAAAEQPAETTETAAAGGGQFAELLANASAEAGERVFRKCQACHTLEEGKHRVGPSLYSVIGRDIASREGFNYSSALAQAEGDWTLSKLDAYIENPNEAIPGNKMAFAGLKDPQDRINVLTYIDQADGTQDLRE